MMHAHIYAHITTYIHTCIPLGTGGGVNSKSYLLSRIERNVQLCTEKSSFIILHSMEYGGVWGYGVRGQFNFSFIWNFNEMDSSTEKGHVH